MQVAPIESKMEDVESERYQKFKTYRELTESSVGETAPGVYLGDRHNYFAKFHDHLKKSALDILKSDKYIENDVSQVMDLFYALKITPRITESPGVKTVEKIVQIEVDCDYDAFFADIQSRIYTSVLNYFRDMLV